MQHVRKEIGATANPDVIQCTLGLPKTRFRQDHVPFFAQDRREWAGKYGRDQHTGKPICCWLFDLQ